MAPICDSELTSLSTNAEICPTEVSTEYDDAERRCKVEKAIISEGTQVTPPPPPLQVIEEVVPSPPTAVVVLPQPAS